jgi:flagellar hook-basal body complex protein FliE
MIAALQGWAGVSSASLRSLDTSGACGVLGAPSGFGPPLGAGSCVAPRASAPPGSFGESGASAAAASPAPGAFARLFEQPLQQLDASVATAEAGLRDLAAGRPVELHTLMVGIERARIGVQTFVQVRNRLVESYQDLMRMPL